MKVDAAALKKAQALWSTVTAEAPQAGEAAERTDDSCELAAEKTHQKVLSANDTVTSDKETVTTNVCLSDKETVTTNVYL